MAVAMRCYGLDRVQEDAGAGDWGWSGGVTAWAAQICQFRRFVLHAARFATELEWHVLYDQFRIGRFRVGGNCAPSVPQRISVDMFEPADVQDQLGRPGPMWEMASELTE